MFPPNIQKIGKKSPFKNDVRVIRASRNFATRLLGGGACRARLSVNRVWAFNDYSILLFAAMWIVVAPAVSQAEFQCKASVSYSWQRGEAAQQTTFFSGAEGVADTEEGAKAALGEKISREEPKAIAECRRLHENLSQCVATKYTALGGVLGSMSFSSRKSLEESINKDCVAAQGVCTGSKVSEIKCQERKAAVPPADASQPAGGAEAGGAAPAAAENKAEASGKANEKANENDSAAPTK